MAIAELNIIADDIQFTCGDELAFYSEIKQTNQLIYRTTTQLMPLRQDPLGAQWWINSGSLQVRNRTILLFNISSYYNGNSSKSLDKEHLITLNLKSASAISYIKDSIFCTFPHF